MNKFFLLICLFSLTAKADVDDALNRIGWEVRQYMPEVEGKRISINVDIDLNVKSPFYYESSANCLVDGLLYPLADECRFGEVKDSNQCTIEIRGLSQRTLKAGTVKGVVERTQGRRGYDFFKMNYSFMNLYLKLDDAPGRDWDVAKISCRMGHPEKFSLYSLKYRLEHLLGTFGEAVVLD